MNNIQNEIKNIMTEFRYLHSLRVAKMAKELAKHYKLDEDKAYLCGLIHDIAKDFSDEDIKKYVEKYNLDRSLLNDMDIIHAEIGPLYIKENYKFVTDDILQAIKYHTIGNQNMNIFDKIIFIADKIARNNLDEEMMQVKELAFKDLDQALIKYLKISQKRLEKKGKIMHPDTIILLNKLSK